MNDSRIRFDIWARVEKLRLVPPDPSYRAKPFLAVDQAMVLTLPLSPRWINPMTEGFSYFARLRR
jgi:hypothetical protein